MTIAEYAAELAEQVRAEGTEGPSLRLALQLAAQMWLDVRRSGKAEFQWGLFAGDVETVTERLFPQPPDTVIILELTDPADIEACNGAARQLIAAAADVLHAAAREPGQPRAWEYAIAAQRLRTSVEHLP